MSGGFFNVICPKMTNELAPREISGAAGTIWQVMVTAGILFITLIPISIINPTPDPKKPDVFPNSDDYYKTIWYIVFSCPILFAVLQLVLILIFFNYDSPNILKQNNDDIKLRELFAKIYTSSVIEDRIDEIQVVGTNTENLSPEDEKLDSYSSVFCSSYYGRASMVGCLMAVF